MVRLDAEKGVLEVLADLEARPPALAPDLRAHHRGVGRELFGAMRRVVSAAEEGACTLFVDEDEA